MTVRYESEWVSDNRRNMHLFLEALLPEWKGHWGYMSERDKYMMDMFTEHVVVEHGIPELSQEGVICDKLVAGPNSANTLSWLPLETELGTMDAVVEVPPLVQDASAKVPPLVSEASAPKDGKPSSQALKAVTDLPEYYRKVFQTIDANQGKFTLTWNWASFLFGLFWYFYRGMWGKALIMLVACFLLAGLPAPFFWIYCGIAGNYDYYLLKVRDKQLW